MQVIKDTIKVYTTNPRKLDYILKYGYNNGVDICTVGAGVGERGNTYILFLSNNAFFEALEEWESIKRVN